MTFITKVCAGVLSLYFERLVILHFEQLEQLEQILMDQAYVLAHFLFVCLDGQILASRVIATLVRIHRLLVAFYCLLGLVKYNKFRVASKHQ